MFWNRNAKTFDSIYTGRKTSIRVFLDRVFRKDMYQRFAFTVANAAPIEGKKVLDVGCGTGLYCFAFAEKKAAEVHGIDISDEMIEICKRRVMEKGLSSVCHFTQSNPLTMRLAGPYDVSIAIGVFDYISDPLPLLNWMRSHTGEKVILSFPMLGTWRVPVRKVRLWLKRCPVYFYTKSKILSLLDLAGMKVGKIEKVGHLYCVVALTGGPLREDA
jgi:predicted TPR repeat methyltransferase